MPADRLHVIAVVSNPAQFQSRIALFRQFVAHMEAAGVHLIVVEHAFANRPFAVTQSHNPDHIQLRGRDGYEIWLKESLINVGFRHLTDTVPGWDKAAWIDADVAFMRPDWVQATLDALDHYAVIQPWSHSVDLGPDHAPLVNEWATMSTARSARPSWRGGSSRRSRIARSRARCGTARIGAATMAMPGRSGARPMRRSAA